MMESTPVSPVGIGAPTQSAVVVPDGLDPGVSWALAGGRWYWGRPEFSDDPAVLDGSGRWVVCLPADGPMLAARFPHTAPMGVDPAGSVGPGDHPEAPRRSSTQRSDTSGSSTSRSWASSLSHQDYSQRVDDIRRMIADGDVYQVNLTRRLAGPTRRDDPGASALALTTALATGQRAPFGASLCLPEHGVWVVGASPERFLSRDGDLVVSEPIKGTAATADRLTPKDRAENVMICDLVRNDLGRVCRPGTIDVPDLLRLESHPGLVHLVTTVSGRLRPKVGWADLLDATFPPGSVTGAPKLAALEVIESLEPRGRGPYCGALGWVDADAQTADLAVSIRTFWAAADDDAGDWRWTFGTGGAITWDSNAQSEWSETELKADRLLALAEAPLTSTGAPPGPDNHTVRTW